MSGIAHLAATIAAHLRAWDASPAFVELAVYASADPIVIAETINAFCLRVLGTPVAHGLFYQSSVGSVTGVALADGRSMVIKVHQPERTCGFLTEIIRIQSYLWERGVFATKVLAGPTPLAHGLATVETFSDLGTMADAHDPEIRRALAHGLHRIVVTCEALAASTSIRSQLPASAQGSLWPRPHSKLFDFAASSSGAEWIDEIALFARQRMKPVGRRVIGHGDWRQEHARFAGNQLVVAFDWDSLCCELEPVLLGSVTHGFCADWSDTSHRQAPTLAEARAFVADYEDARGASFSPDERRLCSASFGYACAYTARCSHCGGSDDREKFGTFQNLVWAEGTNLLDW